MNRQFLAISQITFAEVTRQPAFGLVLLGALIFQALSPALAMFGFGQDLALLKDFGVSTVFLAGVLLVALGTSTCLSREFERKTIHTLLSKPVSPAVFLAGRFVGLLGTLVAATYLLLLVLWLAARQGPPESIHHPWDGPVLIGGFGSALTALILAAILAHRFSRPYPAVALQVGCAALGAGFLLATLFDPEWKLQAPGEAWDPLVGKAVLLVLLGILMLESLAILLSLVLRGGTVFAVLVLFAAGLLVGGAETWLSWPLPALEVYWVGELFYRPGADLPASYLLEAALYSASYSLVCLLIGAWILKRREPG
jgi:hypothetical protein